ncbi:puromycin-sensitive aminopeptidase-like [Porites lutea]|uniref:puromycin-sensitive aminopeptidase-like n=1 Tax=Porites lutea TaxID=51062 RepID=UPI003CC637D9
MYNFSEAKAPWKVPTAVSTSDNPTEPAAETLSEEASCILTVSGIGQGQWIKLNPGQVGFYRVQYSSALLELLLPAIRDNTLPPRDRLGLQSDLFALLSETSKQLIRQFSRNILTTFGQNFLMNVLLGHLDALLRGIVLGVLGRSSHSATISEVRKRFDTHCNGEATIPADLRSAVYSTVLKNGDASSLEAMMKLFKKADLHEERARLMRTMGAVTQPELIKQVLDFSLSSEVRSQDTIYVIAGVTHRFHKRFIAPYPWYHVEDNIQTIRLRCCICYAHVRSIYDMDIPCGGCQMMMDLDLEL